MWFALIFIYRLLLSRHVLAFILQVFLNIVIMKILKLQKFFYVLLCLFTLAGCAGDSPEEMSDKPEEEKPGEEKPEEGEDIILGENTTRLTADFIDHVSAPVTGMQIMMDASAPKSLLPQKGDILLNCETSEKFPYGFLGKVSQVKADGSGYLIETEKAYLDEAFEKLYVEGVMDAVVEEIPQTKSDSRPTQEISWKLYENGDYKGLSTSYTIKALHGCSTGSSLGFTLETGFYFQYIIDINNKIKKPLVSFSLQNIWNFAANINLEYSKETNDDIYNTRLASFPLVPKVAAGKVAEIILRPEIVLDLVARADGKINMATNLSALLEYVIGVEYKDGEWKAGFRTYSNNTPVCESFKFSMEGSCAFGLECAFKVKLFSEKLASMSMPFFVGDKVSAELSHEFIAAYDYEELSENVITFGLPYVSAEVKANILKGDKRGDDMDYSMDFSQKVDNSFNEKKLHLFPKFENFSARRLQADKSMVLASSVVTHELLLPVDIDYKIYSENGEVSDERNWIKYYKEGDISSPFEKAFSGLNSSLKYKVVPVVKLPIWGEVEALPTIDIDAEISVETLGGEVGKSRDYITFLGGFDPKIEDVSEYGFCYTTDGSEPSVDNGRMVVNGHTQGCFSTVLQPVVENTIYKFRAYLVVEKEIYYGEIKTIIVEEDLEDSLLIGKWKLVKNEGESIYDGELMTDEPYFWPWGDLAINDDGTMIAEAGLLKRISGKWNMMEANTWTFLYEDEGRLLGFACIVKDLTEGSLVLYSPPGFYNEDDPKDQSWWMATFQRME